MRWCFSDDLEVSLAADRESALTALRRLEPEVITLDLGFWKTSSGWRPWPRSLS